MRKPALIIIILVLTPLVHGQPPQITPSDIFAYQDRLKDRQKRAMTQIGPSKSDLDTYREFLKQPKTGITRLVFPKECPLPISERKNNLDRFAKECPTTFLPGGGSNFSFRRREYVLPVQADLTIKTNVMFSSGVLAQGIMMKLGDIPITGITLSSQAIKFLRDFVPATSPEEIDAQSAAFNKGLKQDGYLYARGFKIEERQTFALRVIAYRGDLSSEVEVSDSERARITQELRNNPDPVVRAPERASIDVKGKVDPLHGDDRKDIIVAFRVVRIESDGSATVIWKELQSKDAPKVTIKK